MSAISAGGDSLSGGEDASITSSQANAMLSDNDSVADIMQGTIPYHTILYYTIL